MTTHQLLHGIKDTIITGAYADAAELLRQYQIEHYTERLTEEQRKGNIHAIMFLRNELFNLKNKNYAAA